MLIKYMPAERLDCLQTGLFRITQPQFLNDPPGEARFAPFYNRFSEADYEYARTKYRKSWLYERTEPDKKFLEENFLLPTGQRYTLEGYPLMHGFSEYLSTDALDRAQAITLVDKINNDVLKIMNEKIGIFSLAYSNINHEMWLKYGEHGRGIALEFDENHNFFLDHKPQYIIYSNEERASITYYEGTIRINGVKIKNGYPSHIDLQEYLFKEIDLKELYKRLFFVKNERWINEEEHRIVFDLNNYDHKIDSSIFLKKIPFECFKSITLGWDWSENKISELVETIRSNHQLNHIKLQQVQYGKLENYDQLEIINIPFSQKSLFESQE